MTRRLAKRLPTAKVFTYEGVKFWIAPWAEPMFVSEVMDDGNQIWTRVEAGSTEHGILERHGW